MDDYVVEVAAPDGSVVSLPAKMARILLDDGWRPVLLPVETDAAHDAPNDAADAADTEV